MAVCPRPGKCVNDDLIKAGVHFCSRCFCPYQSEILSGLERELQDLAKKFPLNCALSPEVRARIQWLFSEIQEVHSHGKKNGD